jgi:hypothetical protein
MKQKTSANSTYPKGWVSYSKDSFVVNHPDSYRDGENRHLRQARKRYAPL